MSELSIGVEEHESISKSIKIYPNPVSNTLWITNEQNEFENSEVEITNCLGQVVLKGLFQNEIDVTDLARGCYVLKIISSEKQFYSKFVKE